MANWAATASENCLPLIELLQNEIRSGPLINIDESPAYESIFYRDRIVDHFNKSKNYGMFLKESKLDPTLVVVIEDSTIGVKAANLACIAFDSFNNCELRKYADFTLSSYDELRDLFGLNKISPREGH